MINWLCGAPPARPPHSAAVKASVTEHHASVVSITGITPICCSNDNGGRGGRGALVATFGSPSADIKEHGTTHPASPAASPPIRGVGILIHPTLVLTTHSTIPSPHCIKDAEITFCRDVSSLTYVKRKFVPDIFFETDVELDVTVVSCEIVAPNLSYSLPLDTTKVRRRAIRKDHPIFIMGCQVRKPDDIVIMEGCIAGVVRSKPLQNSVFLRFQTAGNEIWMPGTAGFDEFGSFAFIVTKPPAKLQEDMQSPSFKLNNEQASVRGSILSVDRSQASPITARFFAHKTKQWATCVQAIKDWVQPLWKENRNEVFEGSVQPLKIAKQMRRPSTPGDALFRQKSFTPRNSISAIAQGQSSPCGKTGNDVERADITTQDPAVLSHEMKVEASPSPCMEESSAGPKAMVPASDNQHQEPDAEMKKAHPPKRAISYKQRFSKNIVFTALSKRNNGLKKLTQQAIKSKMPAMESVSVQTTTPPDVEKEPAEEVKDPNPLVSIRRASEESSEAGVRSEVKKTNAGREKWSLPGELDPIAKNADNKQPIMSKGSNAIASSAKRGMQSQRPGASAWIDNYYSLGRSHSDHSLKSSRADLSSASTSNRAQRDVPLVVDYLLSGAEKDYGYDPQVPEDNPPNMQRSLSSPSSSVYNKPTISYMQRRSLNQREQLARRASQSSNSPRWS